MALTILTGSSQAAATNYSYTTSGSADWASVPTASYFYDIVDKTVRFKATNSTFSNIATASFALTASNVASASYALTASYVVTALTASYVTASNVVGTVISASYALSASWAPGGGGTPGGSDQAVQFNNGGTLGGETFFRYDSVKKSISNGINVTASGFYSHAEGYYTIASGTGSHAEGSSTTANGFASHAEGENTQAIGDYSHTEGYNTTAGSNQGYLATTVTTGSCTLDASYGDLSAEYIAGDRVLFDDSAYDGIEGVQTFIVDNVVWDTTNTIITFTNPFVTTPTAIIGNLTYGIGNWAGGYPIGGQYSHAEGVGTYALGPYSHAEGFSTKAIGARSHAEGSDTQAIGNYSHAEGDGTETIGSRSHAEGVATQAIGDNSHAEGYSTQSSGSHSHAEGQGTYTTGQASHAEGASTIAHGIASHTEGDTTTAYGIASHTEGNTTQTGFDQGYLVTAVGVGTCSLDISYGDVTAEYAPGDIILFDDTPFDNVYGVQTFTVYSVYFIGGTTYVSFTDTSVNTTTAIIGNLTTGPETWTGGYPVGGAYSHAEGIGTIALGDGQHVSGQYNTIGDTTSLFIVGNGYVDDKDIIRSDAFKVTPSGSIILPSIVSSAAPSWTGTDGEMIFGDDGDGNHKIFVWVSGGWKTSTLT